MKKPVEPPPPTVYEAKIPFDERRLAVLIELMQITKLPTPELAIRHAIWHYAHFQQMKNLHHDDL